MFGPRALRPLARAAPRAAVHARPSARFMSSLPKPSSSSGSGSSSGEAEHGKTLFLTTAAITVLVTAATTALDIRAKHVHPSEPKDEEEAEEAQEAEELAEEAQPAESEHAEGSEPVPARNDTSDKKEEGVKSVVVEKLAEAKEGESASRAAVRRRDVMCHERTSGAELCHERSSSSSWRC